MNQRDLNKAAFRGEPSYVWRAGQERRLDMIIRAAGERIHGRVLENGCGVGMYLKRLADLALRSPSAPPRSERQGRLGSDPSKSRVIGLEYDFDRAVEAKVHWKEVINAAGEFIPLPSSTFDLILSHEVLEHVQDDALAVREMIRVLRSPDPVSGKPGGRVVIFAPNRGYPFETHGIFWRGKYYFGNKPFVNYLPRRWRNKLAPHVRVYSKGDLGKLLEGQPVKFIERTIIFGAYDNIIARFGILGRTLRMILQFLERTPLRELGLSHFWVVEKL